VEEWSDPSKRTSFRLRGSDEHPRLLSNVVASLPDGLSVGTINPPHSITQRRSHCCNRCSRCDRLFGEFMLGNSLQAEQLLCSILIRTTDDW